MSDRCIACGSRATSAMVSVQRIPVHCNILWETREQALAAPQGDMELRFCRACGHLFNAAFDPALVEYMHAYENSLHYSPRFRRYATSVVERLIERYAIRGRQVVDVGCGKGEFLRLLCDSGGNRGVGFDPSYNPERDEGTPSDVTFVQDYYSAQYAHLEADLICCRHVLEHIADPARFLADLRANPGVTSDTVLYFEVPNGLFTVRDMGIWDLIYEHTSYFTPDSLRALFRTAGFEVLDLAEDFGGQYLYVEARPSSLRPEAGERQPTVMLEELISDFAHRYESRVTYWRQQLEAASHAGKRCMLWGAGSKGVTFANIMGTSSALVGIVDINPHKQGLFVPGTGTRVVGLDELSEFAPDEVFLMNPLYRDEIRQSMKAQGVNADTTLV
ncbi:MAG: class I SAM-dependent methyltransferase [Pseudomonadota bacterium]